MIWFISEEAVWSVSYPVPIDEAPELLTFGTLIISGGGPWVPEWMTAPAQIAGWFTNISDLSSVFLGVRCFDDGTNTRQN